MAGKSLTMRPACFPKNILKMTKMKEILRRPFLINPPRLQSLVKHTDNSGFRIKTTTPKSLVILTKDTLNHFIWNPSGQKMDDQEGRLARFTKKYTLSTDITKDLSQGEGRRVLEKKAVIPTTITTTSASKKKK